MNHAARLTFINQATADDDVSVVFYQRDIATHDAPLAWRVIDRPVRGTPYTFDVPAELTVHLIDAWHNHTPMLPAIPGQTFEVINDHSGTVLRRGHHGGPHTEFAVHNMTPRDTFTAEVRRGGLPLARRPNLGPDDVAAFEFVPTILVAAMARATPGEALPDPAPAQRPAEFPLHGLVSATITLRGGAGVPLAFTMDHVVR